MGGGDYSKGDLGRLEGKARQKITREGSREERIIIKMRRERHDQKKVAKGEA